MHRRLTPAEGLIRVERVLELVTTDQLGIEPGSRPATMVSFIDLRNMPLAALLHATVRAAIHIE